MTPHVAIIGGGPFCTYAIERLAALLPHLDLPHGLRISVFDRTGRVGAGATHSDTQSESSYMNRVASQIAFGADESNVGAGHLLPLALRPTFAEWSNARYEETGDERFNLRPEDVPRRYLHGYALKEMFDRCVTIIQRMKHVTLDCYTAEVSDVLAADDDSSSFYLHVGAHPGWRMHVHHILFVTGHSDNHCAPRSLAEKLTQHARATPPARYINQPYPLREQLTEQTVPAGSRVALLGMGLTAIDIILHLTEGRGGTFEESSELSQCPTLRYVRSGHEPKSIVPVSPSGMFTSSRPNNEKALDPSGTGHGSLEHKGIFLTIEAVRDLRRNHGVPATLTDGEVHQLDFERHVFPLVVLEMACVYYATLFGKRFGDELQRAVQARYRSFLIEPKHSHESSIDWLLEPVQEQFENIATHVDLARAGSAIPDSLRGFEESEVLDTFLLTVYGPSRDESRSPWGHSGVAWDHRFDWRAFFNPIGSGEDIGSDAWNSRMKNYMRSDHLAAAQGNLRNPTKAACDGVWRDLRSVFSEIADFGGLTAQSQRRFMQIYWRFYARMSNGTGLPAMRKLLALIEAGVVDVSIGPRPRVEPVIGSPTYRVHGTACGGQREVDVVVEGRAHTFDPERDTCSLYPNMFRRGLVRRWRNPGGNASLDFYPGGLDLSKAFHPVRADGYVDPRLTILGSPAEGVAFFQLSAGRPRSNSSILNNLARWANELTAAISATGARPVAQRDPSAVPDDDLSIVAFRSRIRSVLARESTEHTPRSVVVLAIDGIPYDLARTSWPGTQMTKMRSVFPSTSSTAWLSSLTGADVACHGVPGVAFKDTEGGLITVFQYEGPLGSPTTGNIFSDAAALGYFPISVMGDLEPYPCSWRDALLRHSQAVTGHRFFTDPSPWTPNAQGERILKAITTCLEAKSSPLPKLVWCFIDADQHIHNAGYDDDLVRFLGVIDEIALELARRGTIVVAHSDHGLTPTNHSLRIERLMGDLESQYGCVLGGAGRTRWLYPLPGTRRDVTATLERELPSTIRVCSADEIFREGSLARARVGELVLIAEGDEFITFSGHRFDHGSLTDVELNVPLAQWPT